jgi:membrane protease subunit HflK
MAWNDSGNGKDPWNKDDQEPNDLDQIVRNWQRKIRSIIGGGGSAGSSSDSSSGAYVLGILLFVAWAFTGWYRVDAAERGVEQRFGAYTATTQPGLRWHFPFPIETVDIVNIEQVNDSQFRTEMLTADEQYVFIDMVVQFRRNNPYDYSFKVFDPERTLQDVTESALRGVVGTSSLELLIGEQRAQITADTQKELQKTLDSYSAGIAVTSINLSVVDYPQSVQEAVDDTQKARNDRDRYELEARTYSNDIIPKARGAAQRVLQDAQAYRLRVIADAEGESARFEALLVEYQKAPKVTRDRLYLEAVEEVYGNTNKVIIDSKGSGNLLYLPLDKLMESSRSRPAGDESNRASDSQIPGGNADSSRSTDRDRGTRQ